MSFLHKLEKKVTDAVNRYRLKKQGVSYSELPFIRGIIKVRTNGGTVKVGKKNKWLSRASANPVGRAGNIGLYTKPSGTITIGDNVQMSNTLIYAQVSVTIEDYVMIGGGVQVFDNDFHSISFDERMLKGDNKVRWKPVTIKRGAFIGANAIILKGVEVGEKSIVGAGSVVTRSIPPGQIWAGNPAQFIKSIEE
ncbi:MAG: acetyltransferase-like isoleucine patch superfamily enzyme [Neolewinella sp.]|jgi:acetyltransferase-like isoleucine patch superfamily enzyme